MTDTRVETNTQVIIDGWSWHLPADHDLVELMSQIEAAARSGPSFVHLSDGDGMVGVLVGRQSKVAITVTSKRTGPARDTLTFEPTLATDLTDWDL
ncbi:hypothetical protein ACIP5T_16120 [Microbacterium sp. NPDC088619]|uniref:hypothetical protein n=1 Tax=Microbacterium sp. NPDC088619 TaxID=3364196 RepID=UPI00380FF1EB